MKSTFIIASFFTAALAVPAALMPLPDDMKPMCSGNLDFCLGSPAGKCECERSNVHMINQRLRENGCNKRIQVSLDCVDLTPPFRPTGTGTATMPIGTGIMDGTKACGRGLPQCPIGYTCREKFPGKVADVMACYKDHRSRPHEPPHGIPTLPPARVCGGFMGKECPVGYFCKYEELPTDVVVSDREGTCMRARPLPPKPRVGVPVDTEPAANESLAEPTPVKTPSPTASSPQATAGLN